MIYNIKNEKIDIKRVFKVAKAKKGKPASYKCICEEGSAISGDIQKTLFDETIYDEDKVMISGINTVTGVKHFFYVTRKNNGTLKFKQYKNNVYKNPTDAKMLNHIVSPGKTRFLISSFVRNNGIISALLTVMTAVLGFVYCKTSGQNFTNFTYIAPKLALPLIAMIFTYVFWLQKMYQESMFTALATSGLTLFAAIVDFDFTNVGIVTHMFKSDTYLVYGFLAVSVIILLTITLPVKQWYSHFMIPIFYIAISMLTINAVILGKFGTAYSLYVLGKIAFTISLFLLLYVYEKWHNERVFCDCIMKADNNRSEEEDIQESKYYADNFVINEENEYKSFFTRLFESLGNKDCIRYYNTFKLSGMHKKIDLEVYALVKTNSEQIDEFEVIYKLPNQKDELKEVLSDTELFEKNPDIMLVCCDTVDEIYYIKGRVKNSKIIFYRSEESNSAKLIKLVSQIDKEFDELASKDISSENK